MSELKVHIGERLRNIESRISTHCTAVGRPLEAVRLVLVTKYAAPDAVRAAVDLGYHALAENYVQQGSAKMRQIEAESGIRLERHFIGTLQRNKAKAAVEFFDLIQSVDSLKLLNELQKAASVAECVQRVLLQVNVANDAAKSGCAVSQVEDLSREALVRENLQLEGLMTIGALNCTEAERREEFRTLRRLRDELQDRVDPGIVDLSMGMSDDYLLAIEEGATMLRLGSAVFDFE